jgi:hypothetical protein
MSLKFDHWIWRTDDHSRSEGNSRRRCPDSGTEGKALTLRELYTRYAPPGETPPSEAKLRAAMRYLDQDPRSDGFRLAKLQAYLGGASLTEIAREYCASEYGISRQAVANTIRLAVLAIRKRALGLPTHAVRPGPKPTCGCGECAVCRRRLKQARWRAGRVDNPKQKPPK